MAGVPFIFGNATTSIPLSNLDANFNTGVTIGNTTVGLGNTVTTLGNVTLTNVNIVSGTVPTANSIVNGTSNVVIASSGGNITMATNNSEAMRLDSLQNVLIATTAYTGIDTGSQRLTIQGIAGGNGGTLGLISDSLGRNIVLTDSSKTQIATYSLSSTIANIGTNTSLPLAFNTAATERMRIDTSGNLLVGTTAQFNACKVGISADIGSFNIFSIRNSGGGTGTYVGFLNSSNSTVGSISYNGSLTLYNTTSDYRLKNVIGAVTNAGTRIDALEPIEYDLKTGGRINGFLAHKFAEVYPNSVTGEKDAVDAEGKPVYQAMQASSSEVMADLIAEIQSLRKRVAQLESK